MFHEIIWAEVLTEGKPVQVHILNVCSRGLQICFSIQFFSARNGKRLQGAVAFLFAPCVVVDLMQVTSVAETFSDFPTSE